MWCGTSSGGWIVASTLNPCVFDTIAALVLVCVGGFSLWQGRLYLASLARLGRDRTHLWSVAQSRTPHRVQAAVAIALASIHALAFAVSLGTGHPAPYVPTVEATLAIVWTCVAVRPFFFSSTKVILKR